jgi:hypothetical protein
VAQRQLCERRRVARSLDEDVVGFLDRLFDLTRVTQARNEEGPRLDRVRVILDEIVEPVGGVLVLPAPAADFAQGDRHFGRVFGDLGRRLELDLGAGEVAHGREDNPQIVLGFPEHWVHRRGFSQEGDRARASVRLLGGLDPLHHLRYRGRVCRG